MTIVAAQAAKILAGRSSPRSNLATPIVGTTARNSRTSGARKGVSAPASASTTPTMPAAITAPASNRRAVTEPGLICSPAGDGPAAAPIRR